jgi:peptidoglycan hydrolase-like protein with peptidoglycan-binding domain
VKAIQQALLNLNLLPERRSKGVTQNFLDVTQNNVELFQRYYKPSEVKNQIHKYKRDDLLIDGIVDQNTILAMDEALVNGWKFNKLRHSYWDTNETLNKIAMGTATGNDKKEYKKSAEQDNNVKAIQQALHGLGLLLELKKGEVTSTFGKITEENVELFQRYYKPSEANSQIHKYNRSDLIINGIVDQNTILAMDEALMNGWKFDKFWIYEVTSGKFTNPEGKHIATGYSGKQGIWQNNVAYEREKDHGPIPRGIWKMKNSAEMAEIRSTPTSNTIPLVPMPETSTYGRHSFLIHGDHITEPGTASEGCIVLGKDERLKIINHPNRMLRVVT